MLVIFWYNRLPTHLGRSKPVLIWSAECAIYPLSSINTSKGVYG